ncbi:Hypothetical predicted protein [Pelobates cultripes]|uniref:Uncharacterized protein n=1 Tax=Pelobates cultripes TaxID=61616 RepID=A0AAD1WM31_PELCU|nr:Hypothetical predicted protein [Pelobates cultripes]
MQDRHAKQDGKKNPPKKYPPVFRPENISQDTLYPRKAAWEKLQRRKLNVPRMCERRLPRIKANTPNKHHNQNRIVRFNM